VNILIVCNHYAVCSARYASAAFERLGHTVKHIGPAMGRNIWGLTLPPEYVWEPDGNLNDFHEWPDLVVVMDSDPAILQAWGDDWNGLSDMVVWGVDDHVRDYRREWFDHYFLAHRNVSVMDWQADMTHLPCSYDPTLHTPSPIPFEERAYDVCMIGVMYEHRWQLVQALRDAGFKVLAGTGLVYESYAQAYQNARISLCLSSNGDVAQRVFETARMGCVVMSDNCADYPVLKPDGIWLLDDLTPEIVVQAVRDVLHEPEHAQAMIARSMAWAEPFSWDNAARKVVDWYERRN
jgi:glycosyltransferase involved in cell wall biosynthesis